VTGPSARAFEVLDLVVAGHSVAEIADRLHLSPFTVRNHAARLRTHFGVPRHRNLGVFVLNQRLEACRLELARKTREVAALDRRGKVSTADVIGPPLGSA
jgi:DNA-binding NarL/FixJ family response regulator